VADAVSPALVTVIVPAFNAAATIDETLRSVRVQTHQQLEIIVVDDGSRDATAEIVRRHAEEDPRIRLIEQPNAGVAAARNRGIAEATADLVAPIDADDLWRPDKIEKQLVALHRGGAAVGLVYTWSARIDATNRLLDQSPGARHAGIVTYEICRNNFIGNGSAVLMRKSAVQEAGGYDPNLRAQSAEGVEDWLLYFRIATRHQFAVVPEHLTGYRYLPTSMSMNIAKMLKGYDLVAAEMCLKYPQWTDDIKRDRLYYLTDYQFMNALRTKHLGNVLAAMVLVLREGAVRGAVKVGVITFRSVIRFVSNRLPRLKIRDEKTLARRFVS